MSDMRSWTIAVGLAILVHCAILAIPIERGAAPEPPRRVRVSIRAAPAPSPPSPAASMPAPARVSKPLSQPPSKPPSKPPGLAHAGGPRPGSRQDLDSQHPAASERVPDPVPLVPAAGIARSMPLPAVVAETGALERAADAAPGPASMAAPGQLHMNQDAYARAVRRQIAANKRYPPRARRRGQQGEVEITIVVGPDGRLARPPRLTRSSGVAVLDREAIRMAGAAAPFAPSSGRGPVTITIPVHFSVSE